MAEGRLSEPVWRVIWEEVLGDEARHRVRRAIRHGHALDDPNEAAVALERALRQRRAANRVVLANVLLGILLMSLSFYLVDLPASPAFWWLMALWSLVVLVSPLLGWLRRRQLDRAISANGDGRPTA